MLTQQAMSNPHFIHQSRSPTIHITKKKKMLCLKFSGGSGIFSVGPLYTVQSFHCHWFDNHIPFLETNLFHLSRKFGKSSTQKWLGRVYLSWVILVSPIFPTTWPHAGGPLVNRKTVDCSEFRTLKTQLWRFRNDTFSHAGSLSSQISTCFHMVC